MKLNTIGQAVVEFYYRRWEDLAVWTAVAALGFTAQTFVTPDQLDGVVAATVGGIFMNVIRKIKNATQK